MQDNFGNAPSNGVRDSTAPRALAAHHEVHRGIAVTRTSTDANRQTMMLGQEAIN